MQGHEGVAARHQGVHETTKTLGNYYYEHVVCVCWSFFHVLLQGINAHGVARVGYMLKVMQPMVAELGQAAGQRRHEALKAMEHCKSYYQMLALSTDALLQQAVAAPTKCGALLYVEAWLTV